MTRLSPSAATLHVADTGSNLQTWWETATPDLFQRLRASFESVFPRPGEATWQREASAWAVPYRYQKRLNKWIARNFEAEAVRWEQRWQQDAAGARANETHARATAVDLLAAYETLHLLPTAPPALVTAAYRCLAKLNHPDQGGDDAAMVRLNEAVTCIRAHQSGTARRP